MVGSNLPPGCSVSDIPGNRPEDFAQEAKYEAIAAALDKHLPAELAENEGLIEELAKLLDAAYSDGYSEGAADSNMASAYERGEL